jgi:hypothetical protein
MVYLAILHHTDCRIRRLASYPNSWPPASKTRRATSCLVIRQ